MKKYLLLILLVASLHSFSQSTSENEIIKLSDKIFSWEVNNKIDSLATIFHDQFIVVGSNGNSQGKIEYINRLKSGAFIHDSINIEERTATVLENTAIITGKGKFAVNASGNKVTLHLSYMEVFTRPNKKAAWQVLAMKANALEK